MSRALSWQYEVMTTWSRPMKTLSTKYSKNWSRVSTVSMVACANFLWNAPMEASSSNRVALTCSALGLDGGVEFLFLGLQGVHGLGGARVEYALGDRLDEVGKLGLYVRAACLQSLEDLVPAPVGLLVVVG